MTSGYFFNCGKCRMDKIVGNEIIMKMVNWRENIENVDIMVKLWRSVSATWLSEFSDARPHFQKIPPIHCLFSIVRTIQTILTKDKQFKQKGYWKKSEKVWIIFLMHTFHWTYVRVEKKFFVKLTSGHFRKIFVNMSTISWHTATAGVTV